MGEHHHHRAVEPVEVVVDRLDRAVEPVLLRQQDGDEDAERDEAHVADRRVGDQLLHVRLDERHERAVDDGDDREDDDRDRPVLGAFREERQVEAEHAVAAHLQHDRRQDDRGRRRRLDVGVRQPGVEREHRHLDREGDEEGREDRALEDVAVGALSPALSAVRGC